MQDEIRMNRKHKDRLFRKIFQKKEDLLSLYNALNNSDYTDAQALQKYIVLNHLDIYSSKLVCLPLPQYYVFYNGTKEMPDESILYLTDSMEDADAAEKSSAQFKAHMININAGHSSGIMKEILLGNKAEVTEMILQEYDENLHIANEKEISYQEGHEIGRKEGVEIGRKEERKRSEIFRQKLQGKSDGEIAESLEVSLETVREILLEVKLSD